MADAGAIVVTGASRGIGAGIALELAHRGYTVGCLSRQGRGPETSAASAIAARFVNVACDVTDEGALRNAIAEVQKRAGGIQGLVNNAGIHLEAPSHELATATFDKLMATNASAVFAACREVYPYLIRNGGGTIVNIGSFFDKMGVKRNVAYCASKAAVGAITRCLAVEWAGKGIRVMDVAPGYIVTDLNRDALKNGPLAEFVKKRIPSGRTGSVEDVARLVASLFVEKIDFLSGETIYIDGAQGVTH